MENQRAVIAIALSVAILMIYQYFFVPAPQPVPETVTVTAPEDKSQTKGEVPVLTGKQVLGGTQPLPLQAGRDIPVENDLYRAVIAEANGVVKSFQLKKYREVLDHQSGPKELIRVEPAEGLPLFFSWGVEPAQADHLLYAASASSVTVADDEAKTLVLTGKLPSGLEIERRYTFSRNDYRIGLAITVHNRSAVPLQGAPYLTLVNRPFTGEESQFLFQGPAAYLGGVLHEVKVDDIKKAGGSTSLTGSVRWTAYEDTYFMTAIVPEGVGQATAHFSAADESRVTTVLAGAADTIAPQASKEYRYTLYFGPKELQLLKTLGNDLERAVDFGWFDVIARPTLYLLNFLYKYVGNYGIAIILVTVLIKLIFWPISQKGMESMKTLQKIQPKMAKLREKYKDDKVLQQQEMMKLYQTYKVNPLGGCLPMLLQIPVFFALYKVLLQSIELRHAPFMLWITDLAAPDRLYIGFDIPWLHGIPVLTLLMGGSMFVQQKMTPTTGDPTQAKIMLFMPVIFTFMFLNFASGLVLYWLVNNLLTIGQQYLVNRETATAE
ncbi:MAG: membrane protein insertase YidC [Thermodesulfobacteriota bacterium]